MKTHSKKLIVSAVALAVLLVAGAAVALWSSTGTGSGRATALSAQSVTVTASTGTADLYPGFADGDVYFTLTNPNPYEITFTSMTSGTVTSSNVGACPSSNVTVGTATGLSLVVAANSTSGALSIADVAAMDSAAPDGCQGVSFDVALTLTGTQS
jgi:hypothetical protein